MKQNVLKWQRRAGGSCLLKPTSPCSAGECSSGRAYSSNGCPCCHKPANAPLLRLFWPVGDREDCWGHGQRTRQSGSQSNICTLKPLGEQNLDPHFFLLSTKLALRKYPASGGLRERCTVGTRFPRRGPTSPDRGSELQTEGSFLARLLMER